MKKIVIISSSLRNGSNSEILAKEFEKGAKAAGNEVEFISLKGKKIGYCIGCLTCQKTKKCIIKDDSIYIVDKIKNADAVCFATPVYYYGMSGQLKTLLDRCNPMYDTDYKFRDVYLITTAAENEKGTMDGTLKGMTGWLDCFENAQLSGIVYGYGIEKSNSAMKQIETMEKAYMLGRNV